MTNNSLYLNI